MLTGTVRRTGVSILLLASAVVICLVPFAGKAFHIDDPLFVWTARYIQTHPRDPYGFRVNWYSHETPMAEVTMNPPLASYYMACVAWWFGWNEVVLHLAFLVPAIATIVGTYYLARQLCSDPVLAGLATLITPVFLISSTTVMCDTMMLAFWIWAVVCWVRGMERNPQVLLPLSGFMIAAAVMTKYFAVSLIPLLFGYSLVKKRKCGWWAISLLMPIAVAVLYDWVTRRLYGKGLLLEALSYATTIGQSINPSVGARTLVALIFTGGCLATVLCFAPFLWSRRTVLAGALGVVIAALTIHYSRAIGGFTLPAGGLPGWLIPLQCSLFALAGVSLLALVLTDLSKSRDAESAFLALWIVGTFVFVGYFNWTVNGRSVLPMAPAFGILLARRVEQRRLSLGAGSEVWSKPLMALIPAVLVALWVTHADYRLANSARTAAVVAHEKLKSRPGRVWFVGHWGFQYYMESYGGRPIDLHGTPIATGDVVVLPRNNTNLAPLPRERLYPLEQIDLPAGCWGSTICPEMGACFYSSVWGPLPFVFGPVPREQYLILQSR